MHKTLLLTIALGVARVAAAQTASPVGVWRNPDQQGFAFEIYACGNQLCGKFAAVPTDPATGQPLTDPENPDPKLRGRSRLGLVFMQHFISDKPNTWTQGRIYNPADGRTYSALLTLKSPTTLEVRGYLGFSLLGQSQTWTRLK